MARTNRRSGDGTPQFYGRWARLSIPLPRARRGWKSRAWRAPLQKKEDRTSLLSGPLSFFIPERATGFEPVTSSLGSWHSTPELRPQSGRNVFSHPTRCQRGIVPAAVHRDQRVGLFRSPRAALVWDRPGMGFEDGIDRPPGRFDRIPSREERTVAAHGVAQQALVGRLGADQLLDQIQLALVADELFAWALDARGQGDRGVGREPEAQIIRWTGRRCRVGDQLRRGRLQRNQHLGGRRGETFSRTQIPRDALPPP